MGKPNDLQPTDKALAELAHGMPVQPWGIGSRREDAFAFARAAIQLEHAEAARRLRELSEALDAFDTGGFSEEKVTRINAARKAAREYAGSGAFAAPPPAWDDLKVAFSIEDAEKFTTWAAKTRAFYSDGTAGFPKGWELVELNGAGTRCVAVFRVEGAFHPQDGVAVAKLLSTVGGYPYDAAPAAKQDKSGPSL